MTEKDPQTPIELERKLAALYEAPAPDPAFSRRLRLDLIAHANQPSRMHTLWNHLTTAGRVGLSLAGVALLLALVILGAQLLPHPAAILPAQPAPYSTATLPTVTSTPTLSADDLRLAPSVCTNLVTPPPSNANHNRPGKTIGGGVVSSGNFQFDIWLFCDDHYTPDGKSYSKIRGLALHEAWWYGGEDMVDGPMIVYNGFDPDINPIARSGPQHKGAGMYGDSGINIAQDAPLNWSSGSVPLRYVHKVRGADGKFSGVQLTFRLELSAGGILIRDIKLAPLSTQELAESAKPVIYTVQPGDTWEWIGAFTMFSIADLHQLNGLALDAPLVPGRKLIVGFSGSPRLTPMP